MGSQQSIQKCNFEDVLYCIQRNGSVLLINTLGENEQSCLILTTIPIQNETTYVNLLLAKNTNVRIIVYGKNANDESVYKKYNQFLQLGFTNICVYIGGMFEWLCLQDIYGDEEFPTTTKELDILKFKSTSKYIQPLAIENID